MSYKLFTKCNARLIAPSLLAHSLQSYIVTPFRKFWTFWNSRQGQGRTISPNPTDPPRTLSPVIISLACQTARYGMNFCRARGRSRYCRTLQGSTGHHRITAGHQAYRITAGHQAYRIPQDNRRTPRLQDTTGQPQDTRPTGQPQDTRPTGYHRITARHQAYRTPGLQDTTG